MRRRGRRRQRRAGEMERGAGQVDLPAVEVAYQVITFERRDLNDEETVQWGAALDLGEAAKAMNLYASSRRWVPLGMAQ